MFFKSYRPALGWALVILVLTLLPPQALPKVPKWDLISVSSLAHVTVFLVWAFLLLYGFFRTEANFSSRAKGTWLALLLAVSYGALIEVLQGIMRLGRQPDIVDIGYNTIGAVMGILLFYFVRRTLKLADGRQRFP